MTTAEAESLSRHFYLAYDPRSRIFTAYAYQKETGTWAPVEVSRGLEHILDLCKSKGLRVFEGLDAEAAELVYDWLHKDRVAVQYVEGLWENLGGTSEPRPIGFQHPTNDTNPRNS